ncbi:protein disulfide isomerase [Trypanosoma theileri]|uniref:Protein disulfide isomerase n=1 Tax=Trypanosoma theileri TaxID=67003 RepID=A0A1X0NT33_9TRYP|nr:protein disulfide isomerase [Trypanosoma theileri]ORC87623.1 protein disulfide isomerase [Trypanosoma theileri]
MVSIVNARGQKREIRSLLLGIVIAIVMLLGILVITMRIQGGSIDYPTEGPGALIKGVVELDAYNFYSVIGQSTYVLIEFYATWCDYCQRFVPEYTDLSMRVQNDTTLREKVVLAKMDGTRANKANTGFAIAGYPTLYLVPPHQKTGKEYTGSNKADDIFNFLKKSVV